MFKNILIPISSEYYSKEVLERSVFLAEKFKSTINLIYIIEVKTLNQTDKESDSYRTPYEIAETKNEIRNKQKQAADQIVFEDAKFYLKNKKIPFEGKIIEGEFSNIVKREINFKSYDLILMGFEKECNLNYRLLDDIDVSVWVESERDGNSILAICSNLAPNKKVPEMSIKLTKILGWNLHMIYVVDTEDTVQVDEQGKRSTKKPKKALFSTGENFVKEMIKKGINVELIQGSFEKETLKAAEKINPNLIVVGREQKKKGMLGLPVRNLKRKLAEKCKYSILFLN